MARPHPEGNVDSASNRYGGGGSDDGKPGVGVVGLYRMLVVNKVLVVDGVSFVVNELGAESKKERVVGLELAMIGELVVMAVFVV